MRLASQVIQRSCLECVGTAGTAGTAGTPYFIYFSILILIFQNICFMWEIKFIYPFYPSHLLLSVPLYIPYLIRLKINNNIYPIIILS
jgi:hypothetical protein